jgi:hypothetical protein
MLDAVAARSSDRSCRTQAQVSGIYFDLVCNYDDPDCNARQDAEGKPHAPCAKNIYLGDGCRMPDGTFNGTKCKPLDPFGEYRVAVNDYIAQGGSGFTVLKRNTTKFNTGISLRDALIDYIRTLPDPENPTQLNLCSKHLTDYTNIVGVQCKDAQGETFDCTASCCCHDPMGDQLACATNCDTFKLCSAGVLCKDAMGNSVDCTTQCCGHDETSGDARCSANSPQFAACAQKGMQPKVTFLSPQPYDFRDSVCLDQSVQAHDGRIQTQGAGPGGA